jgi:hypothetical protein
MKAGKIGLVAVTVLAAAGMVSYGEEVEANGWSFEVTPYIWMAGLDGDITVGDRTADFEKDASDLLNALDVGGSVRIGAEKNRVLVGALIDYFSLSTDELDVEDQPQHSTLDSDLTMIEALVGYRVDGWAEGQTFGLAVGVRHLQIDNDLTVDGVGTTSRDNEITDAMIYILPSVPMFASSVEGLRFNPVLGIGSGDSDLAYELFPQIQYNFNENIAMRFGYRRVGWNFEGDSNDNELDISLAGLILGLGVTF